MKTKFQSLTKKEKKEAINKYYQTPQGQANKKRFTRLLIISILCILWGLYVFIEELISDESIWNYVTAITMFIAGIIFFVGRHKVLSNNVNNYLIQKKK